MKLIIALLFLSVLSGCVNAVVFEDEDNNGLLECQEIQQIGDMLNLFELLKIETNSVHRLLDNPTPNAREEITLHAKNIEEIGRKINKLTTPGLIDEHYQYDAHWLITEKLFKSKLGSHLPGGFKIFSAEVESVYFMGEKRDDLKQFVNVEKVEGVKKDTFAITYKNKSSPLFLCQLKKAMLITIVVKARNLNIDKDYYVNLYIND